MAIFFAMYILFNSAASAHTVLGEDGFVGAGMSRDDGVCRKLSASPTTMIPAGRGAVCVRERNDEPEKIRFEGHVERPGRAYYWRPTYYIRWIGAFPSLSWEEDWSSAKKKCFNSPMILRNRPG